jgi:DNA-binding CsgD family transcriptional regulator
MEALAESEESEGQVASAATWTTETSPSTRTASSGSSSNLVLVRVLYATLMFPRHGYAERARGERARPRHGWASLTPTEQRVVELVVAGHTNPEIAERLLMGRGTVESHLEHVYAKTGCRNRAELAAVAVEHRHHDR